MQCFWAVIAILGYIWATFFMCNGLHFSRRKRCLINFQEWVWLPIFCLFCVQNQGREFTFLIKIVRINFAPMLHFRFSTNVSVQQVGCTFVGVAEGTELRKPVQRNVCPIMSNVIQYGKETMQDIAQFFHASKLSLLFKECIESSTCSKHLYSTLSLCLTVWCHFSGYGSCIFTGWGLESVSFPLSLHSTICFWWASNMY